MELSQVKLVDVLFNWATERGHPNNGCVAESVGAEMALVEGRMGEVISLCQRSLIMKVGSKITNMITLALGLWLWR